MSKSVQNVKVTIGGPESSPGDAETRDTVIPISGMPTLRKLPEFIKDPVIRGQNMAAENILVAYNVAGSIPMSPRACAGFGKPLNSLLGDTNITNYTRPQIAALLRIRYTGSEASCKMSADTSGDTLTSETGDKGSETGDDNFGSSGDIDLTAAATDTVGELVAVIDAYDDYECEKLLGIDGVDAADIIDITAAQGKNTWVYVWFSSAASGVYAHQWPVYLPNTYERPTYSIQADGLHDNYLYDGCVVDKMTLSAALKAAVEGSADILGMEETTGQGANSTELPEVDPLIFANGDFSLVDAEYAYIRNISLDFNGNHNPDGYGMGSLARTYQEKAMFNLGGTMQFRYHSDIYAERPKVFSGAVAPISLYFTGATLATSITEMLLIELPYCNLNDYEESENAGVIDAMIPFEAYRPKNSPYNAPVKVTLVTTDSGAY